MSAGLRSPRLRSPILPPAPIVSHRPVKSGLPSAVRGAEAARFGVPSAVRGMPGVRYCAHCAVSGVTNALKTIAVVKSFIGPNLLGVNYTPKDGGQVGRICLRERLDHIHQPAEYRYRRDGHGYPFGRTLPWTFGHSVIVLHLFFQA